MWAKTTKGTRCLVVREGTLKLTSKEDIEDTKKITNQNWKGQWIIWKMRNKRGRKIRMWWGAGCRSCACTLTTTDWVPEKDFKTLTDNSGIAIQISAQWKQMKNEHRHKKRKTNKKNTTIKYFTILCSYQGRSLFLIKYLEVCGKSLF